MRLHVGHVGHLLNLTTGTLCKHCTNQVVVITPVHIESKGDTIVQEAKVYTNIKFVFLLIGQLTIS